MDLLDWSIIGLYFVLVFGVAWWAWRREAEEGRSAGGYFLAGREIGWVVVGSSLFVSNIGSEHLIGLSGTGADSGIAVAQFEIWACLILLLLGWVFVPFYIRSGIYTTPEFLERRFSAAARLYFSIVSIISYVLTKIAVTLYAGGIVFEALLGVSFWIGAVAVIIATGIYTLLGGLRAVVYTDFVQMIVLLAGYGVLTVMGVAAVGGWGELQSILGESHFDLWLPMDHKSFPWTGILLGAPILGIWYWCTDQFIVQRTLSARDADHARRGSIMAGYLKLLPLLLFVLPGVVAAALQSQGKISFEEADEALPTLIAYLLPTGLRGLVVAGLLAALMSSLGSVLNSCSTLITQDLYLKWRPDTPDSRLAWIGRITTGVLVLLALAWVPLMGLISERLYEYLQAVQSYIAPPVVAVFVFGLAWSWVNAQAAMATLLTGFVLGAGRLILELVHGADQTGLPSGSVWAAIAEFNFLHFAVVLFLICAAVLVGVSLIGARPKPEKIEGLTWANVDAGEKRVEELPRLRSRSRWRRIDTVASVVLALLVLALWIHFEQ